MYVRVTKYSFPPLTRSLYSPVGRGWTSSTAEIFTTTDGQSRHWAPARRRETTSNIPKMWKLPEASE